MSRHIFSSILCIGLSAALVPAVVLGATKGAPAAAAAPEPLNSFKAEEPKKDEKKDTANAPAAPAATSAPNPASGAAPAAATPAPAVPPPPAGATSSVAPATPTATAPATAPTAPAEPPAQNAPTAAASSPAPSAPEAVTQLLRDVTITDVLIALFALLVALFAWRVSRASAHAAATTQGQLDANRRAIEASERSAEAARRSAEAAERSAAVLQETAARQLRPYVTVKEFLQGPVKDENNFLHGWVFQVVWQNSGATPTRGFRYWAALRQFDHAIPEDFDFAPPVMADFAGGELGSNSTVTSGTLFVPQTDVVQIQSGARKAVLYGKAEYNDVLGGDAKRETRFAVEVILVADPAGANGTPFSFSYYPRHNAIS